jgi:multidrug efflux pump subunit AcrB
VLAHGIVVDDAIVVLENVERLMRTRGMPFERRSRRCARCPRGGAIVLVLCAVFIPVAFLGGIAARFTASSP